MSTGLLRHTAYSELKTRLAEARGNDRRAYTAGKDRFIRSILATRPTERKPAR